jgi:WD40 repeat protein
VLRVYDLTTGKPCFEQAIELDASKFSPPIISPDGKLVGMAWQAASGVDPWTVRVWDRDTAKTAWERQLPNGAWGFAEFSPDGRTLTVECGPTRLLLDTARGEERWRIQVRGVTPRPERSDPILSELTPDKSVVFSADSRRLAVPIQKGTTSGYRGIAVYDTASGAEISRLDGNGVGQTPFSFHPDGVRLLVAEAAQWKVVDTDFGLVLTIRPTKLGQKLDGWADGGRKLVGYDFGNGRRFEIDATPLPEPKK